MYRIFVLAILVSVFSVSCGSICEGDWINPDKSYKILVNEFFIDRAVVCVNGQYKIDVAYNKKDKWTRGIDEDIKIGDLIIAPSYSDTIYLKKDKKVFLVYKIWIDQKS